MAYVIIAVCFGISGGMIGKLKGSSFLLWFLISGHRPVLRAARRDRLPLRARRAAPAVPGLRAGDEDLRRDLHPLRDRARVPRRRDRARILAAHAGRPAAERPPARVRAALTPILAALSRSRGLRCRPMAMNCRPRRRPPPATRSIARLIHRAGFDDERGLRPARRAAGARRHDRRHGLLAGADLRGGDRLQLAHRPARRILDRPRGRRQHGLVGGPVGHRRADRPRLGGRARGDHRRHDDARAASSTRCRS